MTRRLMMLAHHIIWTCYGTWLPNDPRGSTSKTVRTDAISELGELHYGRKQVQPLGRDIRAFYQNAKSVLRFPILTLDEPARQVVAHALGEVIAADKLTCWACAVMPDHVHILIRKHRLSFEEMMNHFKDASAAALRAAGLFPHDHPVWTAHGGWSIFLDHPTDVRRTVGYVERNPDPYHLPRQVHPFVVPYDDWPLHPGHHPDSPYARIMKENGVYRV